MAGKWLLLSYREAFVYCEGAHGCHVTSHHGSRLGLLLSILKLSVGCSQCSPYQAETNKIYGLKQQEQPVLTACNLLKVY